MSSNFPLMPGDVIPSFSCGIVKSNMAVKMWSTSELKSSYTVFFFFPMTSAVDASEVGALRDAIGDFQKRNCTVYGVTTESVLSTLAWMEKSPEAGGFGGATKFDILSDRDASISELFGVKLRSGLPCRATFVVDKRNRIRHSNITSR